jgi:very-short-patch-repair endonuclease
MLLLTLASPFGKGRLRGISLLMLSYNSDLKQLSRELRKNMTDAERRLWSKLRMRQLARFQFYRQRIIGNFIVDFFCPLAKLVIEVDGNRHSSGELVWADRKRDEYLKNLGLKVLRFLDTEVLNNIEGVIETILEDL